MFLRAISKYFKGKERPGKGTRVNATSLRRYINAHLNRFMRVDYTHS